MLFTLIYRSRINGTLSWEALQQLERSARERNTATGVTGILLFDGSHFLQVLEGPEPQVKALFARLRKDPRHHNIVHLLDDYSPRRRFSRWGMELLNVRSDSLPGQPPGFRRWFEDKAASSPEDRALRIINAFVAGSWRGHSIEACSRSSWRFEERPSGFAGSCVVLPDAPCQFALQPIVDPMGERVTSIEALLRSPSGGSPQECFAAVPREALHQFDLESKLHALALAAQLGMGDCKLSINLLPMSLVLIPGAVDFLIDRIAHYGLTPEQIVVEVTEEEAISHLDSFLVAMKRLRAAGISIAIDDFGAGYAGLSLLAKFQPDKLKIDRSIVQGVHADGPRQAIVRSIVEFCRSLGISTVAEGVETTEEWCWLQAAGIERFQGFLFARPLLNGVPAVNWPKRRTELQALAA